MFTNFEYYRIFYFVAKHGSITAAANVLMSAQPNVTRSIRNLERDLGCALFTRSNHGVKLTPEGEKLYEHVAIAYAQIAEGEAELAAYNSMEKGVIRIGVSETALHEALLTALENYRRLYPGVHVNILNYSSQTAIAALKNGAVDFAMIATPFDADSGLKSTHVKFFHDIAVCGKDYSELSGRVVRFRELINYPIVSLGKPSRTFDFYSKLFARKGISFTPDTEVSTSDQILPIIRRNLGVGLLPESFATKDIADGEVLVINLAEKIPPREICLIKRNDHSLSIAAKEFERVTLETFKSAEK